jgi:ATP sulfurylase
MILPVSSDLARSVGRGEEIVVRSEERLGSAILRVRDVYALDLDAIGRRWFGSDSADHPGMASILAAGTHAIAADVLDCQASITRFPGYELEPAEARMVFEQKGWTKVVAAPTRAVADDADGQRDLLRLLANANADGLYLPALVARRGADEVRDDLVLKSHALVLGASDGAAGRVVLGALSTADRHCPEREVLFDAIRLRNLGCTHFVLSPGYPSAAHVAAQGRIVRLIEQCEEHGIGATWSEPTPHRAEDRGARSTNTPAQLA